MRTRQIGLVALATALVLAALLGLHAAGRGGDHDPRARARMLEAQLRCPVCAGQSVAESRTETAAAMRAQVEALVADGHRDGQVRDWFAARYGRTILLLPPTRGPDLALWLTPLLPTLVVAGWLVRRRRSADQRVSPAGRGVPPAAP